MTEVERAHVVIKIDELEKNKKSKQAKLRNMRSDHVVAWNIYGSKLCAGGMEADKRRIEEEIEELNRKSIYLKDCLKDNRELRADSEILTAKIKGLNQQINTLEILRKADHDNLEWISFALRVCNGEQ